MVLTRLRLQKCSQLHGSMLRMILSRKHRKAIRHTFWSTNMAIEIEIIALFQYLQNLVHFPLAISWERNPPWPKQSRLFCTARKKRKEKLQNFPENVPKYYRLPKTRAKNTRVVFQVLKSFDKAFRNRSLSREIVDLLGSNRSNRTGSSVEFVRIFSFN